MQETPILTLDTVNNVNELKIEYLADDFDEIKLNGESIYHIYHVRMITEFLLRELSVYKPEKAIPEEDITAIALASALHDIGKLQVPRSILDLPRALSPVEYDIVKKHTVFGDCARCFTGQGFGVYRSFKICALLRKIRISAKLQILV